MNTTTFLDRALAARTQATLYFLGAGGWELKEERAGRKPAVPGRSIHVRSALQTMQQKDPKKYADYMKELKELEQEGVSMDDLPSVACDCSGFVCWALDIARDSGPWGSEVWINTDAMHKDALGPRKLFSPVDRAEPGTIIVYPKPVPDNGLPGHVGIVTAADAQGNPTRVLHCAPHNFKLAPPEGLPRNAIAETDPEIFLKAARTQLIVWNRFAAG